MVVHLRDLPDIDRQNVETIHRVYAKSLRDLDKSNTVVHHRDLPDLDRQNVETIHRVYARSLRDLDKSNTVVHLRGFSILIDRML